MHVTRRGALVGSVAGAAAVGAAAVGAAVVGERLWRESGPDLHIPDVPPGEFGIEQMRSAARGREVDLFTAVPEGHGDGVGLPVCVVLHGASARPADYEDFGFPQLLTAAVRAGAPPFVLAGADGGAQMWERSGDDDPGRMVTDELPGWLRERGFVVERPAVWGWSMGGYGALRLAQRRPEWVSAVAAFSPVVQEGDPVFADVAELRGVPTGVWCGTDDPLHAGVERLVAALPERPEIVSYGPGGHDMEYWTGVAEDAFAFLGAHLA